MPTLVLSIYTTPYPLVTNRIKVSIYSESDPLAEIASIIDSVSGHPARWWQFPGLVRDNYIVSTDEIDIGGAVVNNIAQFDVVPGELEGMLVRDDEQIQTGVTTGFTAATNTFVFDGTGGKPDYRGWVIVPSELTGRGILDLGLDYSWDKVTGTFLLLQAGDLFATNQVYNIHFNPISEPAGNSYPTITDFEINVVTVDTTLNTNHFGKKLLVEPSSIFIEVTLPDISTVPQGRRVMVEISNVSMCCVRFIPYGSNFINFLRGNIYAIPNETFSIYRYIRAGISEWRVCEADGNFKSCGQLVSDDAVQADVFNKILLNGSSLFAEQYARLYNEFVLNLPIGQVVSYDDWSTGNNKYFYSLANSANPANAGKFMIPDRRNMFERNTPIAGVSGTFQQHQMLDHQHYQTIGNLPTSLFGKWLGIVTRGLYGGTGSGNLDMTSVPKGAGTGFDLSPYLGSETRPINNFVNKYVVI